MKFSERMGFESKVKIIQKDSIDDALKNGLWNCIDIHFLSLRRIGSSYSANWQWSEEGKALIRNIYFNFSLPKKFSKTLDEINTPTVEYRNLKNFFFEAEFFEVYNFCEFLVSSVDNLHIKKAFMKMCNSKLETHISGYRFVDGQISPIISEEEIESIEESCGLSGKYKEAGAHINKSLEFLSKKPNPAYHSSIEESVKAVEAVCRLLVNKPGSTLGGCLEEMFKVSVFNDEKALLEVLKNFWKYSSNFVRHATKPESVEKSKIEFAEAKFSLVMCSATVNFLKEKYGNL